MSVKVTLVFVGTDYESRTRPRMEKNVWHVFRRTSSRGGRGRLAAVDFLVCFGCGGIS